MHGGSSRHYKMTRKKSFRLFFKKEYGVAKLVYPVFGKTATGHFDTLVLRMGGHDSWHWRPNPGVYIRDRFSRYLQRSLGAPSAHSRPVHLYLNGIYWGVYDLVERPDSAFAASYLGGDKDEWDTLNSGSPANARGDAVRHRRTKQAWRDLLELVKAIPLQGAESERTKIYAGLQGLDVDGRVDPAASVWLNMENYIDYLLVNFYCGNADWPGNNYFVSRRRGLKSTGWHFFTWDMELTLLQTSDASINVMSSRKGVMAPFSFLRHSEEFRLKFADRVQRAFFGDGQLYAHPLLSDWDPERSGNNRPAQLFDALAREMERPLVAESARWGDQHSPGRPLTVEEHWKPEVASVLRSFFPRRSRIVLQQLKDAGLYPSLAAPGF
ncbi:MAG: CotH kinase family protein, partial [Verrucomicrobiota bacterium]